MAIHLLSASFCRNVERPGKYSDGLGLMLRVEPSGAKTWVQRLTIHGKRRDMGLGSYQYVTLADARDMAYQNAKAARHEGRDPREDRRKVVIPTFREAMEQTIAVRLDGRTERYRKDWRRCLELHALPKIGAIRVDAVEMADVLRCVSPHWTTQPKLGKDLRQRLSAVFEWAIASGHRADDPAKLALATLPKQSRKVRHLAALDFAEVPGAYQAIEETDGYAGTRLAVQFVILTATRAAETRCATWAEVDMDAATWTIPAERMKARDEHVVPLSGAALDVLRQAAEIRSDDCVFPGVRGGPIGISAFRRLLERIGAKATMHGFRSSFRDWAAERTDTAREIAELCLAHAVGNQIERAYRRSDLRDKRRDLMERWAAYITRESGTVVQLRG